MSVVFIVIAVVIGISVYLAFRREHEALETQIQSWCRKNGFEFVSFKIANRPHRQGRYGPQVPGMVGFAFRREPGGVVEEQIVVWHGSWSSKMDLDFPTPRLPRSAAVPDEEYEMTELSVEQKIMLEVSRRLDQITSESGWADAYDQDGSGHVDSEEWEALRGKIEAEVRANVAPESAPIRVQSPPNHKHQPFGDSTPVEDEAGEGDGIW